MMQEAWKEEKAFLLQELSREKQENTDLMVKVKKLEADNEELDKFLAQYTQVTELAVQKSKELEEELDKERKKLGSVSDIHSATYSSLVEEKQEQRIVELVSENEKLKRGKKN